MAQQTINVGTAPNDGTGTPLRTAFQYTNSNFSELYTAVGPSGNNIVVPGSATITGDLTVRTNKLAVTSTGVGVGTATPAAGAALSVLGTTSVSASDYTVSSTWASRFQAAANNQPSGILLSGLTSGGSVVPGSLHVEPVANSSRSALIATYAADSAVGYFAINRFSPSAATTSQHFKIDDTGIATWSNVGGVAGTAMTLNSTGLGLGVSPSYKLDIFGTVRVGTANPIVRLETGTNTGFIDYNDTRLQLHAGPLPMYFVAGNTLKMTLDATGNLGIGVTPSVWQSTFKALQSLGGAIGSNSASQYNVLQNAYINTSGAWAYTTGTTVATMFRQNSGAFEFFNASGGASPSWIQAMTLDASGNLLVGTTNTSSTAGVGFKSQFSSTVPQFAIVVNEAGTSTNFSIYNVNAAAYRFYVNNGGTVFATNTTISAISDARLKENVQDIDVGLGAILALKPRKFDWKAGKGKDIKGDRGFIAQEFEQVFPNLIDEWKDPAPEGEAPYKSVRQDLIPVLVKAIQELTARVQTLETR